MFQDDCRLASTDFLTGRGFVKPTHMPAPAGNQQAAPRQTGQQHQDTQT
jgi:hypothetical protein